jgi:DNA-binding transcriptional MerR regulator
MQGLYTTKQVSDRLGISQRQVRTLAQNMQLGVLVNPRLRLFTEANIERMRQRDTQRGPKPKERGGE